MAVAKQITISQVRLDQRNFLNTQDALFITIGPASKGLQP
jgi:hypothetical protein